MLLFLILSTLWLSAAATARVWYHSAPSRYVFPSAGVFYVWLGIGISGAALTLVSLVHILLTNGDGRREAASRHTRGMSVFWFVLVVCIGTGGELLLVLLVTRHAIATAPFGVDSGDGAPPIAALGAAQGLFVGALAPFLSRFWKFVPRHDRRSHDPQWSGLLGLAGMAITCAAFAVWSLHDGTTLIVNTRVIAGTSGMTNSGAWWPGLFAAMSALTAVAIVCAPGIIWRDHDSDKPRAQVPTASFASEAGPLGGGHQGPIRYQ